MDKFINTILQGGPGLAALVFMFIIYSQNKKKSVSNEEIVKRIVKLDEKTEETKDMVSWMKDAHNHVDEDGVFVWHLRKSWLRQQEQIKDVLQDLKIVIRDVHTGQKHQTEVLAALVEKINRK